ncbi:hydroxyisourate hydrolase [Burkholderiaceae bacterium FT117]|uniref:hydroxyisourate hydrolase n=1 Tax=Zeimonas sediminis TaxID=2944268 RepID=UPI002342D595|nr:hydroxyisourate hydrolase [Zeimonas sediminis]MCM5570453.1 hydroxyisourate hydrolase [Zeimonas sediminis]
MAVISSHALDAVRGGHAGGLEVVLRRILPSGEAVTLFRTVTDEGGRLSETVSVAAGHREAEYELAFATAAFLARQGPIPDAPSVMRALVVRFAMPDPDARYHFPISITPASCSVLAIAPGL